MRQSDCKTVRVENLNKPSQGVIEMYQQSRFISKSDWGRFIASTELCKLQKTRVRQLLATWGIVSNVAAELHLDEAIVEILIEGLKETGHVEIFSGGGYGLQYRVCNPEMPKFAD